MARKNVQVVFESWRNGKFHNGIPGGSGLVSIWTTGNMIMSYRTGILLRWKGKVALNTRKYSVTTSTQQRSLRYLLSMANIPYIEVEAGYNRAESDLVDAIEAAIAQEATTV